ncbi:MAG: excinuclease ABC subunit UvrA [Dysgonamonadaceae bacterium]|jgi:excinuclease ABC subunit A|nr:excinuclease ABC subunit UvrA [Dysgonamonadaceae bacterium]
MSYEGNIIIKGARVNNLKGIDIEIPRGKLIVITGLSGSGKSSLAFDTLYAEGQRRYVESLSSYARQFLGRMSKPETDYIKGIPPAIAIQQKVNTRNTRSTVGTSTEIYDYIRMLFARVGKTISPVSGNEVRKHSVNDACDEMSKYPEGTKIMLLTKVIVRSGRTLNEQLNVLQKAGFTRIEANGDTVYIDQLLNGEYDNGNNSPLMLVVDRLTAANDKQTVSRLSDSIETAFYEGDGYAMVKFYTGGGVVVKEFSMKFEEDGIEFEEPSDYMFNFNSSSGACPRCQGLGKVTGVDETLVIPNRSLSIFQEAVLCWKGEVMGEWKRNFIMKADKYGFPVHRPYNQLSQHEKDLLWYGSGDLKGIEDFFQYVEENLNKIQYRVLKERYRGKTVCPACKGTRLKPQANYVKVGGSTLPELVELPLYKLQIFFEQLTLGEHDKLIACRLLGEINNRLQFLSNVGLGYLTLNRMSSTLSGGESQRINLANSLGSSLVGSLYVLDEPSIGLHSRDTALLIKVLRQLQEIGNTVVVVEHDEEIIRSADWIIDIGPEAGKLGGEIIFQGNYKNESHADITNAHSYTIDYLTGKEKIETPSCRRKWNNYIEITGACKNNLKSINVRFPLNVMTVVTGVSGSGKSSLVYDVFYQSVRRYCSNPQDSSLQFSGVSGDLSLVKSVEFVDQNPVGKSSRSNPATYIKVFDEIRKLFADQQLAKQYRLTPACFSFNIEGGRCEECKGDGVITVEMQFMADVTLECESCHGRRFSREVLDVEYNGKNIYDVLEMTVDEAIIFFGNNDKSSSRGGEITSKLRSLHGVGLGYIKLGQNSSTLSGGENQRLKLAQHLGDEYSHTKLFIFDEPTTGLHFHDIKVLLKAFDALISDGHTIIIIEHNLEVIKCADHVIDLGPEGGDNGGKLIFAGTPEELVKCGESFTGCVLKNKL